VSAARIESSGAGRYRVSGELTFATARDLLRAAQTQFAKDAAAEVDLAAVSAADSAGLALLIEWYRTASEAKKAIRFIGAPAQLLALAKISDLEWLLASDSEAVA
jgi:phospholipid transport system transporter-binding protein